ncbi:MAG: hypothetical protein SGBAC_006040 [Bacillariaceae sp.]
MSAIKPNDCSSATSDKEMSNLSDVDVNENNVESPKQPDLVVAKDENRWVWSLRLLVAFVLMAATVAVCLIVYFGGRSDEHEAFEKDFAGLADKLVISFEAAVEQRFGAIDMFFSDVTANANGTWPLVTPPEFTRRITELHSMVGLSFSLLLPRVDKDRRTEWEEYSVANQGWLRESLAFTTGVNKEDVEVDPILPQIFNIHSTDGRGPDTGPGPYFPIWMLHPPQAGININMHNYPPQRDVMDFVIANKRPAFGTNDDYIDPEKPRGREYSVLQSTPNLNYQNDAFAFAQFPVYDNLSENRTVAAIFYTLLYWRKYFSGLLPKGSDGIYVILENTCGQQYTYIVDGLEAKFASHGDLHSPEYDYLKRETTIDLIFDIEESIPDDTTCHYGIRVYPSDEFRDSYTTHEPLQFAIMLGGVFVFTAAVFLLYDCVVERRQKAVMKSAMQSGKIVHSLFPEAVRDRLYEEQEEVNRKATWKADKDAANHKQAIATEYPETTIFFADIVGFTKWSATRTPVEVFQLLEALYGEFDTVANKRRVFKVETIGDCYVAVTGLPKPQESMFRVVFVLGLLRIY